MNTLRLFSKKSLHTLLSLLFFIIPLVYAWLYIPGVPVTLADILPFLGGFEKVKVLFFLGLMTLAGLAFLGTKRLTNKHLALLGIFSVWTIFSYFVNQDVNPYFWSGNPEKLHGWYLYCGLLLLGIILSTSTLKEQKKYLTISLISGSIVCLYALFQKLGLDPIQSLYSSRLDATRIFGTLGNPNYLAGYMLMLLPLALIQMQIKKTMFSTIILVMLVIVLFWTKSLFGIGIFAGYLYYLIVFKYTSLTKVERNVILYASIGILILGIGYGLYSYGAQLVEIQKVKGFIARYFLWETGIHTVFGDIRNTLFGYGPDGFLPVSELFRSPELSVFEDPAFRIDRSHNVWIDLLIHFGIPLGGFIVYSIFYQWKKLPIAHREVLILFSAFFFFNIPVLVHFILLIQILTFREKSIS